MRQTKYYKKRRDRKRGRGIPYIYKNKVHLGKRPQTGIGAVSKIIAHLLENVGNVIRKKYKRQINRKYKRKYKRKIHGRGVFGDAFRTLESFGKLRYKSLGGK